MSFLKGLFGGRTSEEKLANLIEQSIKLMQQKRYKEALVIVQEEQELTRQLVGESHPRYADSLEFLGLLYYEMGDYAQAEPPLKEALEIRRQALAESDPGYADSLGYLGRLYVEMGEYGQAEPLYREVLAIRREALGESHPDYADSLDNLGRLYVNIGDYSQAEPLYREALAITRQALDESHPNYALRLNNLGSLYQEMGDYAQAEPLLKEALEINRQVFGENDPIYAITLNNLGGLYADIGEYDRAESLYQEALAIRRQTVGESDPDYANSLNNLATLYGAKMRDYAQAEPLLKEALEIRRQVFGESHPRYATSLNNLGQLYAAMGDYAQAEPLLKEALEIRRQTVGENHNDYATSLNNLGGLYDDMGDYPQAEPLYREALEVTRQAVGESHPDYADSLNHVAVLCWRGNRLNKALTYILKAAEVTDQVIGQIFSFGSDSQRLAYLNTIQSDTEGLFSLVSQALSDQPEAIVKCFEVLLRRKALGSEGALAQREALLGGRYPALAPQIQQFRIFRQQLIDEMMAGPGDEDMMAYQAQLNAWQDEYRVLEAELARQIPEMNLTQKMRAVNPAAVAEALPPQTILVEFVRFEVYNAKAIVAQGEQEWQPAHYLAFVLPAQMPGAVTMVDLGEAAPIEQLIARFRATITGESETRGAEERSARRKAHKSRAQLGLELGQQVREAIFDPLLPALADCRRVFLSPDGDLTRLPFEILPTKDGAGQRLIDTYTFSYLSVGRDVLRFGAASSGIATAPVVLADPDFDLAADETEAIPAVDQVSQSHEYPWRHHLRDLNRANLHFSRLPGTRLEGEQIAKLLGVTPLLGAEALESQLKTHVSPRILHLATHGYYLEDQEKTPDVALSRSIGFGQDRAGADLERLGGRLENPLLRCGLALAGANTQVKGGVLPDEAENAILNGEDVAGMDLLATDLVVLSACETGLGDVKAGEGVFGLRRAFMLAGAKTLVISLWEVPDKQTQELMTDFYTRILKGEPRADALRQAQLTLKAKYDDPRYWGAFICQGEPGPLPDKKG